MGVEMNLLAKFPQGFESKPLVLLRFWHLFWYRHGLRSGGG